MPPGSRGDARKVTGGKVPFSSVDFPNLHTGNHQITSPADGRYNCIAWAAGIESAWWEPVMPRHWPANAPVDYKVTSLILAYESVGFVICADGSREDGVEKIAIYGVGDEYLHAARQLENGRWTSKIGASEDIEHDALEDLAGPCYGQATVFMKRNRVPAV
jgi:hypothetical protein